MHFSSLRMRCNFLDITVFKTVRYCLSLSPLHLLLLLDWHAQKCAVKKSQDCLGIILQPIHRQVLIATNLFTYQKLNGLSCLPVLQNGVEGSTVAQGSADHLTILLTPGGEDD